VQVLQALRRLQRCSGSSKQQQKLLCAQMLRQACLQQALQLALSLLPMVWLHLTHCCLQQHHQHL
jgi:hypothetical protein